MKPIKECNFPLDKCKIANNALRYVIKQREKLMRKKMELLQGETMESIVR